MMEWWQVLLWCIFTFILGGAAGFFGGRYYFKKELQKNPPINEKMIRVMYQQMGRKTSEAQIRSIMNSVNKQK